MTLFELCILAPIFMTLSIWTFRKILVMLMDEEITAIESLWYFAGYFLLLYVFLSASVYQGLLFLLCIVLLIFNLTIDPIRNAFDESIVDKRYVKNIDNYKKVYAKNPKDWGTLSEIAHCYFKMGKYEDAIRTQTEVVRLSKNDIMEVGKLTDYTKHYDKLKSPGIKCWYCGRMVPKGASKCPNCRRSSMTGEGIKTWFRGVGYKVFFGQIIIAVVVAFISAFIIQYFNISGFFILDFVLVFIVFAYVGYKLLYKNQRK